MSGIEIFIYLIILNRNADNKLQICWFHFQWIPELKHYAPGVPIVLVGTKIGEFMPV